MKQAFIVAAALAISGPAFAQSTTTPSTTTPPAATPSTSATTSSSSQMWFTPPSGQMTNEIRASKLIGTNVKNNASETVGEINELILDKSGKVQAAVVGVGGFLGIGEHEVAVNFQQLHLAKDSSGKDAVTMDANKDTLKSAPEWKWPSTASNGSTTSSSGSTSTTGSSRASTGTSRSTPTTLSAPHSGE